jgi:Ca-activated chloride channel family protein
MKVRTVGALAALGMLLTSFSVWSLTGDGEARTRGRTGAEWSDLGSRPARDGEDRTDSASGASFTRVGALSVDARLGNPRLSGTSSSETFVLVNVKAQRDVSGKSTHGHLAIAIDRSGSMAGKRIANAIAAAQGAVERLPDGDVVSVVDYANSGHVLVAPTELDASTRQRVVAQIGSLRASGETCISCGLDTTRSLLSQRPSAVERVLLLSDGQATAGITDLAGMRNAAASFRSAGATVTTIGVDVDYNERMMTAIAQETNGRHYFVATPEGLPSIFDQELSGLTRSVARGTELELDLAPGVELLDIADRSFQRDGSRVTVALGTFAAGEERSVLARVRVRAEAPGNRPIATASLRFDDLVRDSHEELGGKLVALFTDDGSRSPLDPEVEEKVQRTGAVSALNEANGLFEGGDAAAARDRVEQKLAEVRRGREVAVAAAPAPRKAALGLEFDKQEAALGAAATAFAEPPPAASAATSDELRRSKVVLKQNAQQAADLAF